MKLGFYWILVLVDFRLRLPKSKFRLEIGCTRLTNSFLLSSLERPTCPLGYSKNPLTMSYVLLSCPASDPLHNQLKLPTRPLMSSIPHPIYTPSPPTLTSYIFCNSPNYIAHKHPIYQYRFCILVLFAQYC